MQIVAAAIEALKYCAIHRSFERLRMTDGDDRVAVAPKYRDGRQVSDLARALKKAAALAAPVDHVCNRTRECARRALRRVQRAELRDILLRHGTRAAERASRSKPHERLTEELDYPWNGSEAQPEPDAAAEASRGDQDHPPDSRRAFE